MKYLGIDYGERRVGVALSDSEGKIAFPRDVYQNDSSLLSRLKELAMLERVETIVVGDTRSYSGHANPVTESAESFIRNLEDATGLPVERVREAGSSVEASRLVPGSDKHDDSAAAVILQRRLDGLK
jgi:putative Holliday junction resolvase